MEDQQGNVIDGTARARQWRGSKPKGHPAPDDIEARSDAPKSFAGSLLVPAEMLTTTSTGEHSSVNGHAPQGAAPSRPEASASAPPPTRDVAHQNPFLIPGAGRVEHPVRRSPWTAIASQLARPLRWTRARSRSLHRPQLHARVRPIFLAPPLGRRSALGAVAAAIAVAATTVFVTQSGTTQRAVSRSSGAFAPATGRQSSAATVLSDVDALRAMAARRVAEDARRPSAHRAVLTHRRSPRPAKHRVAAVQYVPATSNAGSAAPVSVTPSYSSSAASSTPTQSAPPTGGDTAGQSSSTSNRPAFGQNGTLGPGTSPNS